MSFKDTKHVEALASASSSAFSDMFESSSTKTLNFSDLELVEKNPQAAWKLPSVNPSQVYADLNMFHLKVVNRVKVKEVVSEVQENCDTNQTVALLDPKEFKLKLNVMALSIFI